MANQTDLWRLGARQLAELIRTKQVSSREVVESHLDRIAAVNDRVNAVVRVLADEARQAADIADAMVAAGGPLGPFHGVPMTVKENIDLAGSATTQGLQAFAEAIPPDDAPHISQLRAAGAIPIGRTNLPDFGLRWHSDNALRGATRNPWDPGRTPGGSSGGEAVALATGMTPLGMGNDYGGSLRVPSQFCGTAALKPTLGRVPWVSLLEPQDFPLTLQLFAVQGPMARRVEDLRAALTVMSSPDPRDPWWVPAPLRGPDLPKRVAVTVDPAGQGVAPDVAAGVRRAADALRDAGYTVDEIEPPAVAQAADLWADQVMTELQTVLMPMLEPVASAEAMQFLGLVQQVKPVLAFQDYILSFAQRGGIARAWSQFQAEWPLVLGPVCTMEPFPVGYDVAGVEEVGEIVRSMRLVVTVNLLGLPAAAAPVGVAQGVPQGVQVIGPRYREDLCLDAAQAIEDRLGLITPIEPA
jgi:amidase